MVDESRTLGMGRVASVAKRFRTASVVIGRAAPTQHWVESFIITFRLVDSLHTTLPASSPLCSAYQPGKQRRRIRAQGAEHKVKKAWYVKYVNKRLGQNVPLNGKRGAE